MTSYVRVGHPPGIYQAQDRWGAPSGTFYANEYGWMDRETWERVQDFQAMPAPPSPADGVLIRIGKWQFTDYAAEMDRKIRLNPGRCTIWQLEVQPPRALPGRRRLHAAVRRAWSAGTGALEPGRRGSTALVARPGALAVAGHPVKCPGCGCPGAYIVTGPAECSNAGCEYFTRKQLESWLGPECLAVYYKYFPPAGWEVVDQLLARFPAPPAVDRSL